MSSYPYIYFLFPVLFVAGVAAGIGLVFWASSTVGPKF